LRELSPAFEAHIGGDVTTLVTCWKLSRPDGVILALTTHDRDLEIDGIVYRANGGLTPTEMQENGGLGVDNMEISGVLSNAGLVEADLLSGRYDGARIDIFLVNWADPGAGTILLKRGALGRISREDGAFTAELRGLTDAFDRPVVEVYSPTCRAELGDARCKRSLKDFERTAAVGSVSEPNSFDAPALTEPDGWYAFGRLRWHTGLNGGLLSDVRAFVGGRVTLFRPPPGPVQANDVFTITAGCAKTLTVCRTKFDNVANFRGDPFVPGIDKVLDFPGIR